MRSTTKGLLIAAAALVVFGLIVIAGTMYFLHGDLSSLNTEHYETKTYEVKGDFDKIDIDTTVDTVSFELSGDGSCRVVCDESEQEVHTVTVEDNTLKIRMKQQTKWGFHFGVSVQEPKMKVYLPKEEYASLKLQTDTGDATLPEDFTFGSAAVKSDTGDLTFLAAVPGTLKIKTDTGGIRVKNTEPKKAEFASGTGDMRIESLKTEGSVSVLTDTGDLKLKNVSCGDLTVESNTGDLRMENVLAAAAFNIKSDTGSVTFNDSDAAEICIITNTGDVNGTLLSEKVFLIETDTGDVNVPKSITGGRCEITTDTGDIDISIAE